jgi:hypothetical protein
MIDARNELVDFKDQIDEGVYALICDAVDGVVESEVARAIDTHVADDAGSAAQVVEDCRCHLEEVMTLLHVVQRQLEAVIGPMRWDEALAIHDLRRALDDLGAHIEQGFEELPEDF